MTRTKLEQLAADEEAIFKDPRWDRIYVAIERFEGTTQEPLVERANAVKELDAALDTISYDDLKATHTGTLVEAISDRIHDYKRKRDQERQQHAAPDQGAEPEQKM